MNSLDVQERAERPVDLLELTNRIRQALESGGVTSMPDPIKRG